MKRENKDKKVLLVYNYTVVEPLGVLFLQNYLEKRNHEVDLIDYQSIPKEFNFNNYDYVGFSILTGSHNQMLKIADKIRDKTKVVIGGPHTISFSEDCKEHADYVVRGFGERNLLKIVNEEIKEKGIYSESTPPSDLLISNREKFYQDDKRKNNPLKEIIASFCCPFKCTYCYNSIVQEEFPSYKFKTRDENSVIQECKSLKKYPLEVICFQDDTFGVDLKWLKKFGEIYKKEVDIPFHCNIRIDLANEKRINLLKEIGCSGVTFSIESASEKIRKELLNRSMTNKQLFKGIEVLKKYDLPFRTQQMIGLPTTTIKDDLELVELNCKINPLLASSTIYSPVRGTPLAEFCIEKGYYDGKNDDISDTLYSHSVLNFSAKRKEQLIILNKLFPILSHIPKGYELAEELVEGNFNLENLYQSTKSHLFDIMYNLDKENAMKTRARGT